MKPILLPLLLCAVAAFAQEEAPAPAAAPAAPAAEVTEAKPAAPAVAAIPAPAAPAPAAVKDEPKAPPRPSMLDDKKPEAPVAAPKEEPKPEAKPELKPEPKAAPAAAKIGLDEDFAFAKAAAEDSDSNVQEAAIEELGLFARRYPDAPQVPEALFLRASLQQKKGDWQPAMAALLRLIHENAGSKIELRAKSAYLELVDKKGSRRQRPALNALVAVPDLASKGDRLSAVWQKLADTAPDAIYEPAADEIRSVFARFPDLKDGDKLQAALARLHAANNKPAASMLSWRKLLALYPESAQRSAAQMTIGDLYSDALRDPKKAIDAYQELVEKYPKAPEVQAALENSARLFDDKLRQYGLAVEMHEKVVKLFPKTPASLKALRSIAKLQRDRLGSPGDAMKTLARLSSMHGGQEGVDALLQAADIARRDLKDFSRQAEYLRKVSDDYASAQEAPQALYDAAGVYEDSLKDNAKAVELYKEVASKFPSHKLAKRSSDRVAKLEKAN
jgi:tetratricopeptide (TPR) repeat protein